MEQRFDTGGITKYEITPEGYLRAWGTIARVGVQTYYDADGTPRRELRLPEEVSSPESLASFGLKPHTNTHPPQFLNSKNTKLYQTGSTDSTVFYDHGFVRVAINVTDQQTIDEITSGKKQQLSAGYGCELDFTPGVWRGQKYDAIQRRIRGNHVSSVQVGRAGEDVKMHVDTWSSPPLKPKAFAAKLDDIYQKVDMDKETATETVAGKTDSPPQPVKREDELKRRITELEARVDDRDRTISELRQQSSDLKSEADQLRTDAVTAKSDLAHHKQTYDEAIAQEVSARFDAWTKARAFLPKTLAESPDSKMTADEIRRAAVENSNPGLNLDGWTSDGINGWFESMLHSKKPKKGVTKPLIDAVKNAYSAGNGSGDSRKKVMLEDDKAWMTTN
ncbi:MAG: DUF2213 domain-containing protein [Cyanobacteriota bacterium]